MLNIDGLVNKRVSIMGVVVKFNTQGTVVGAAILNNEVFYLVQDWKTGNISQYGNKFVLQVIGFWQTEEAMNSQNPYNR